MEVLSDLSVLSAFNGSQVPEAANSNSLNAFGPLLTSSSSVTFPWGPLRNALTSYFATSSTPSTHNHLNPDLIHSGWTGLNLIITAFQRLEVVQNEIETEEVLGWLRGLKIATVRRSLAFETPATGVLQSILANLMEPVPAAELLVYASRSRNASVGYGKPLASTSMSFERGTSTTVSHSRSPPVSQSLAHSLSQSSNHSNHSAHEQTHKGPQGQPINGNTSSVKQQQHSPDSTPESRHLAGLLSASQRGGPKRNSSELGSTPDAAGTSTGLSPQVKKRRGNSLGHLAGRTRDEMVSTSALSSFADFSDHHDVDFASSSSDSEHDDEVDGSYHPAHENGGHAGETFRVPNRPYKYSAYGKGNGASPSTSTATTTSIAPASASNVNGPDANIQVLAQRLSEVTGIPLFKCVETISRFPNEDLSSINPLAPIPDRFLPQNIGLNQSQHIHQQQQQHHQQQQQQQQQNHNNNSMGLQQGRLANRPPIKTSKSSTKATSSIKASSSEDGHSTPVAAPTSSKGGRPQRPHDPNRPNYSYSALIGQAILSTREKRLRLAEIYDYVTDNYAYYKKNECGWQNSIRHNLSLQPVFQKVPDVAMPGKKGCFWTIIEGEEWRFAGGGWKKMEKYETGSSSGHSSSSKKGTTSNGGVTSSGGKKGSTAGGKKMIGSGGIKGGKKDEFDDDDDSESDDDDEMDRLLEREQGLRESGNGDLYSEDDE